MCMCVCVCVSEEVMVCVCLCVCAWFPCCSVIDICDHSVPFEMCFPMISLFVDILFPFPFHTNSVPIHPFQGLFRKVLLAQISPKELVRMSSEKLASEDLAQWREKTIKKVREGGRETELKFAPFCSS